VPVAVLATLALAHPLLALALVPFLAVAGVRAVPRPRAHRPPRHRRRRGGRAAQRGIGRRRPGPRRAARLPAREDVRDRLLAEAEAFHDARLPLAHDLAREQALLEIMTGLGGLAVLLAGAALAASGALAVGAACRCS
jgi:ATP-binding cassette subfamily C protein CydCD